MPSVGPTEVIMLLAAVVVVAVVALVLWSLVRLVVKLVRRLFTR
jgi:hypothetical protein